jgi:hypothetical protein
VAIRDEDRELTDIRFKASGGRFRWGKFFLDRIDGQVDWAGRKVSLTNLNASAYQNGGVKGWALLDIPPHPGTDFRFSIDAENLDLRSLLEGMGTTNRLEGRVTGNLTITDGSDWRPTGWNGYGHAQLTNGFLWDYPVFAFLTPVIDAASPGAGRDKARNAAASFHITNNVIFTDDLELRASTLRLNYRGTVDFQQRLNARVEAELLRDAWLVGPVISLVLTPFSKIFEFEVTGTLSEPVQKPVYVPGFFIKMLSPFDSLKKLFPESLEKPKPSSEPNPANGAK